MNRRESSRRSRIGAWAGGGAGIVGVFAVLILASPIASASGVTSFTAPYTGFTSTTSNSLYSSGCTAVAREPVSPAWNAATGIFVFSGKASAGSCPTGYSSAAVTGQTIITSPTFSGTHGGTSIVYVDWSYSVAAKASVAISSAANYSFSGASVSASVFTQLIDVTNGSYTYVTSASSTLFGANFYSNGRFVLVQGPTGVYQYLYGTLQKGHAYELSLWITVSVAVDMDTASGSASASVNLGGTNGITLTSISVY